MNSMKELKTFTKSDLETVNIKIFCEPIRLLNLEGAIPYL